MTYSPAPLASLKHHCRQEAETSALAKSFATTLQQWMKQNPEGHLNIALDGDLGAGKTTFARHLIQGLGYEGKVKSPTYTLCEPYSLSIKNQSYVAHHFDLYRMRDPLEWQEAGFAEYFDAPGFCLIEWPEKANGTLPPFDIRIELIPGSDENERVITMRALTNDGVDILNHLSSNS